MTTRRPPTNKAAIPSKNAMLAVFIACWHAIVNEEMFEQSVFATEESINQTIIPAAPKAKATIAPPKISPPPIHRNLLTTFDNLVVSILPHTARGSA